MRKTSKNGYNKVMIGSGALAIFTRKKTGEKYMLYDGKVVRANTLKDSRRLLEERQDAAIYSKPVAFAKRLRRKVATDRGK